MSYCSLLTFKNGKLDFQIEFRNAWGGASRIWTSLFNAYIPKKHEYDSWLLTNNGNDRRLWDLAKRQDLPVFERSVHAFTFDRFYVSKENLGRLSGDLMEFAKKYPVGSSVDHLPAWAKWIGENPETEAVALYATSVSENVWLRDKSCPHCGNPIDEQESIPLCEGVEVYQWLSQADSIQKEIVDTADQP